MAKLITEFVDYQQLDTVINENKDTGERTFYIQGPMMLADEKNRNGRVYSKALLEREVMKYNSDKINRKNAIGELDHPPSASINLDRVSHIIESLEMHGNQGIGKARILNTPMGKIAQSLIKDGVQLGVSTRGVGTLTGAKVNEDFRLLAIDIVADPSAQNAYVDGILENKEYIIEGNQIIEASVNDLEKSYAKTNKSDSAAISALIEKFIKSIDLG